MLLERIVFDNINGNIFPITILQNTSLNINYFTVINSKGNILANFLSTANLLNVIITDQTNFEANNSIIIAFGVAASTTIELSEMNGVQTTNFQPIINVSFGEFHLKETKFIDTNYSIYSSE